MVRPPTIVRLNCLLAEADVLSVTRMTKLKFPAFVGVPVSAPLAGFRLSPAGNWPLLTDQE